MPWRTRWWRPATQVGGSLVPWCRARGGPGLRGGCGGGGARVICKRCAHSPGWQRCSGAAGGYVAGAHRWGWAPFVQPPRLLAQRASSRSHARLPLPPRSLRAPAAEGGHATASPVQPSPRCAPNQTPPLCSPHSTLRPPTPPTHPGFTDADEVDFDGFLRMLRVGSYDSLDALDQVRGRGTAAAQAALGGGRARRGSCCWQRLAACPGTHPCLPVVCACQFVLNSYPSPLATVAGGTPGAVCPPLGPPAHAPCRPRPACAVRLALCWQPAQQTQHGPGRQPAPAAGQRAGRRDAAGYAPGHAARLSLRQEAAGTSRGQRAVLIVTSPPRNVQLPSL